MRLSHFIKQEKGQEFTDTIARNFVPLMHQRALKIN